RWGRFVTFAEVGTVPDTFSSVHNLQGHIPGAVVNRRISLTTRVLTSQDQPKCDRKKSEASGRGSLQHTYGGVGAPSTRAWLVGLRPAAGFNVHSCCPPWV